MKKEKTVEELFEEYNVQMPTIVPNRFVSDYVSRGDIEWLVDLVTLCIKYRKLARILFPDLKFIRGVTPWYYIRGRVNGHSFIIGLCNRSISATVSILDYVTVDKHFLETTATEYEFMKELCAYYDLPKRGYLLGAVLENSNKQKVVAETEYTKQLFSTMFRKGQS